MVKSNIYRLFSQLINIEYVWYTINMKKGEMLYETV